ncbi:MAG TPA: succinate dehydrogenase [Candidatus Eisenbacteria bacterium]|nr:succinate dehydrogenase [Candidatus Eisenbacteria bacterium]
MASTSTIWSSETDQSKARGAGAGVPFGKSERRDNWWVAPVTQAVALGLLGLYATWAALQGKYFEFGNYLSPFYSPLFNPSWRPWWLSPAIFILWAPGGFRVTCYYYRKAYYRSFFADPAGCAVGEAKSEGYCGETKFPFILQNIHRYFLYLALLILIPLWYDVVHGFVFDGRFGMGVGSLVILASTGLLTMYTASCHSLRHLVGGKIDCFSCVAGGEQRRKAWSLLTVFNEHHMAWAWWSLLAVCSADFYVRMCAMGVFHDLRFF